MNPNLGRVYWWALYIMACDLAESVLPLPVGRYAIESTPRVWTSSATKPHYISVSYFKNNREHLSFSKKQELFQGIV